MAAKKVVKLVAPVYSKAGRKTGEIALPKELFGQKPNVRLVAQAVRVFLSNQRNAHAKTKTRAEVNRTTRKIYKQKGTGGARHGSRRAPIYVGGGRAHGPKGIETYKLAMPKKMARKAFVGALSDKVSEGCVLVADIEGIEPKTKVFAGYLKKIGAGDSTILHSGDANLWKAGRNLSSVSLVRADLATTYDVVLSKYLILTKEAIDILTKRMGGKN